MENIKFEYPVPLYRQMICENCKKGYDAHKYMYGKCPVCGNKMVSMSTLLIKRLKDK